MKKNNRIACISNSHPTSDQCAEQMNNQHREILYVIGGMMATGAVATAWFLYYAVLNVSFVGGVPF